ncbi:MAG TPA: hypothetical protein VM165_16505 [Planctomycetaceae bacterium]|nr:hypothetical protein [Planctomycetaceae bacterium]
MDNLLLTRRSLFQAVGGGALQVAVGRFLKNSRVTQVTDAAGLTDPLSGASLQADVVAYTAFGHHRTATSADLATGDWQEQHLADSGFQTERHGFQVSQSFVDQALLRAGPQGQTAVNTFPLWPVKFTTAAISRPLADWRVDMAAPALNRVVLLTVPYQPKAEITPELAAQIVAATADGAVAAILITEGPSGDLVALNVTPNAQNWAIPALLVGPKDIPALEAALTSGANVTLSVTGHTEPAAAASNVVGRLERTPGGPWIVVSTPYSGWFQAGGERGSGIAVWRAMARWAAARRSSTANYLFLSTSGHELDEAGIDAFLLEEAPPPAQVRAWFHCGAWVASYDWKSGRRGQPPVRLTTPNTRFLVAPANPGRELLPLLAVPKLISSRGTPLGEVEQLWQAGYTQAIGIVGTNIPFHTQSDGADNTGPDQLEPVARAVAKYLTGVEAAG